MKFFVLALGILFSNLCVGQVESYDVFIFSNTASQGPTNVLWQLRNESNVILFSGALSFSVDVSSYTIPVELEQGCYELRLVGNGQSNPSSFYGNIQQEGAVLPPTSNLVFGTQVFEYPICTTIVGEVCNAQFEVVQLENGLISIVNQSTSSSVLNYSWFLGNEVVASELENPEFQFTANGAYSVCLYAYSMTENVITCEDEFCQQVVIDNYFNEDCPADFFSSGECSNWIFELDQVGPNAQVIWSFGEEEIVGGNFIQYNFPESGIYQVCAITETPDCPEGVQVCQTIEVDECGSQECAIEIVAINLGNSTFEFTAYGSPEVYPMYWNFGDGATLAATWVVEHVYSQIGEYEVCAFVEAPNCGIPVGDCITVTVTSTNPCTDVSIGIDSFIQDGGASFFEYSLINANTESVLLSGVAQYSINVPYFDLMACLEEGCYDLILCPGSNPINWQAVNLLATGGIVINSWDPACGGNGRIYHLSLNSKCDQGCLNNLVSVILESEVEPNLSIPIHFEFNSELIENTLELIVENGLSQDLEFCVPMDCYDLSIGVLSEESLLGSIVVLSDGELLVNSPLEIQGSASFLLENIPVGFPQGVSCLTSVDENLQDSLVVYPNPSQGWMYLDGNTQGIFYIHDMGGRLVGSHSKSEGNWMDLTHLAPGVYIIRSGSNAVRIILE